MATHTRTHVHTHGHARMSGVRTRARKRVPLAPPPPLPARAAARPQPPHAAPALRVQEQCEALKQQVGSLQDALRSMAQEREVRGRALWNGSGGGGGTLGLLPRRRLQ